MTVNSSSSNNNNNQPTNNRLLKCGPNMYRNMQPNTSLCGEFFSKYFFSFLFFGQKGTTNKKIKQQYNTSNAHVNFILWRILCRFMSIHFQSNVRTVLPIHTCAARLNIHLYVFVFLTRGTYKRTNTFDSKTKNKKRKDYKNEFLWLLNHLIWFFIFS